MLDFFGGTEYTKRSGWSKSPLQLDPELEADLPDMACLLALHVIFGGWCLRIFQRDEKYVMWHSHIPMNNEGFNGTFIGKEPWWTLLVCPKNMGHNDWSFFLELQQKPWNPMTPPRLARDVQVVSELQKATAANADRLVLGTPQLPWCDHSCKEKSCKTLGLFLKKTGQPTRHASPKWKQGNGMKW